MPGKEGVQKKTKTPSERKPQPTVQPNEMVSKSVSAACTPLSVCACVVLMCGAQRVERGGGGGDGGARGGAGGD